MKEQSGFHWSLFSRTVAVVVSAGLVTLLVSTLAVVHVVQNDKEAVLSEAAVRETQRMQSDANHQIELSRTNLRALSAALDAGQVPDLTGLLRGGVVAARSIRAGDEIVDAAVSGKGRAKLKRVPTPPSGRITVLDENHVAVAAKVGEVNSMALVDLSAVIAAPEGWSVKIQPAPTKSSEARKRGVVVARRQSTPGGDIAAVMADSEMGYRISLVAPLAPARSAAVGITQTLVKWSLLALAPLLLLAYFLSRLVTSPLRSLAQAARNWRDTRVDLPQLGSDEVGELGEALHGLKNDAHLLRAALSFSRTAAQLMSVDAVVVELLRALREAFPESGWLVTRPDDVAKGRRPSPPLSPENFADVPEPSSATVEFSQQRGIQKVIRNDLGLPLVSMRSAARPYAVVAGRGAQKDELAVRHAELFCQTALSALHRLELARTAAASENLAIVGRLAAGVGHELNNPLQFILSNLSMLEHNLTGPDRALARDAREGAQRLSRLVRDLAPTTQANSELEVGKVDLVELANATLPVARSGRKRISVRVDAPARAHAQCDPGRVQQVLLNLLINAMDAVASSTDPQVLVRIHQQDDAIVAEVIDNGPGIPPELRASLFDPFRTSKGAAGGLGLYVSRALIEAQGGTLAVADTGPTGTTMRLSFSAEDRISDIVTEPPPPVKTRSSGPAKRRRVLVVDDEPAIVRAFTRQLRRVADVDGLTDPKAALEAAQSGKYALILCDLDMPGMSGAEFVSALESSRPEVADRVVIVTGSIVGVPGHLRVLHKPVDEDQLFEVVNAA